MNWEWWRFHGIAKRLHGLFCFSTNIRTRMIQKFSHMFDMLFSLSFANCGKRALGKLIIVEDGYSYIRRSAVFSFYEHIQKKSATSFEVFVFEQAYQIISNFWHC